MTSRRFLHTLVAGAFGLATMQATGAAANGRDAAAAPADTCSGAAAMEHPACERPYKGPVEPAPEAAGEDKAISYEQDCVAGLPWDPEQYRACTYFSNRNGNKAHVALVGNSHAVHYLPALLELARANHWQLTTYFASQCFPTAVKLKMTQPKQDNCLAWGRWVQQATLDDDNDIDLVVTSNRESVAPVAATGATRYKAWKNGFDRYVDAWLDGGARLLVIRDNPFPGHTGTSVPECVASNWDDFRECSAPRSKWLRADPLADAVRDADSPRARVADLTDLFCGSVCLPVIGGTMVYRDHSHLTATYSRTLAPYLEPYVEKALGEMKNKKAGRG